MQEQPLLDMLNERRDAMLEVLRGYVEHESPSHDKPSLDLLATLIAARYSAIGGSIERIENRHGGDHLIARFGLNAPSGPPPALVIGHYDTVWPVGTLNRLPFRIDEGRAYGPGIFDMKASLVLVEFALETLQSVEHSLTRPVTVLFTADEEIGSPDGRRVIEAEARHAAYALVLESPLPGGRLKTARKGVGGFVVTVHGRAAHAGIEPEKGASAIIELARQILEIDSLADPAAGTTLNIGIIEGGTSPNVVPARASARIDVRVSAGAEAARIEKALHARQSLTPGTTIRIEGGFNRPPMERTEGIAALFDKARRAASRLGMELTEGATGGASDGNFTAAMGLPTLDGLGCLGAGAHAEHEHIEIDHLPRRTALLASLLLNL